jgi:hypothetical protein
VAGRWSGQLRSLGRFHCLKDRDRKPSYTEDLPRFFDDDPGVVMRCLGPSPLLRQLEPSSGGKSEAGIYVLRYQVFKVRNTNADNRAKGR